MTTCIALLRGINVGGRNRLAMKDLSAILEDLGLQAVTTYIQSGNVVFQSPRKRSRKMAGEIASAIGRSRGFEPDVLLLGIEELKEALSGNPFPVQDGKALHVFFLTAAPKAPDLKALAGLAAPAEQFRLEKSVFYLFAPGGIGRSRLAARVEQSLGVRATARNWNTVSRLLEMARESRRDPRGSAAG